MTDELKELNCRLALDVMEAKANGEEEMAAGLQAAMWEVSHLDKPFNYYKGATNNG